MRVKFAEKCAWRAVYVYHKDVQIAYLGFDPESSRPRLFGAIGNKRRDFVKINWVVPHISWPLAARFQFLLPLYNVQQRVLHRIDGRF